MRTTNWQRIIKAILLTGVTVGLVAGCATAGSYKAGFVANTNKSNFKDKTYFDGSQDRGNLGWKLHGVYDPGQKQKIVFEAGYMQLGDTKFDGLWQGVPDAGKIETTTIEASVGYLYPFSEKFSAGGRVGAAYADVKESEIFGGVPYSSSASETVPFGGVVLRFAVGEKWGISASYDRYLDVGKVGETGEGDIDVFGIGADFRFGGSNSDN